jgi:hypothetical protein
MEIGFFQTIETPYNMQLQQTVRRHRARIA